MSSCCSCLFYTDASAGLALSRLQNYSSCAQLGKDPESSLEAESDQKSQKPWTCKDELLYAWTCGEELMVDQMVLPCCCFGEESELRKTIPLSPFAVYNPMWYILIVSIMVVVIPGHLFHSLFGNGEQLRPDELQVETVARKQWVYTYSGTFVVLGGMYSIVLITGMLANYWDYDAAGYISALWVMILYLGGDAHLLFQMRRRNTMMTHACVHGQISWGIAFFIVLILGLFHSDGEWSFAVHWELVRWSHFAGTAFFCLMMAAAISGYTPLLNIVYEERKVKSPPHPWALWFSGFLAALGPTVALILMTIWAAYGHFGDRPFLFLVSPFVIVILFLLTRSAVYGFAWERTWATLVALGPLMMVLGSFAVAGPRLWSFLSG